MLYGICSRVIQSAVEGGLISMEATEEYVYGLELTISAIISYVTVIAIGFMMHMPLEAAMFLIIYTTLRRYVGGFHFNSQLVCYLSNYFICPAVLLAVKYLGFNAVFYSIIISLSSLLLWLSAPIPSANKPLDDKEKKIYRLVSRLMIAFVCVVFFICLNISIWVSKIITISVFVVAVFAVIGIINLRVRKKYQGQQ